jgi:hypothetical protein
LKIRIRGINKSGTEREILHDLTHVETKKIGLYISQTPNKLFKVWCSNIGTYIVPLQNHAGHNAEEHV